MAVPNRSSGNALSNTQITEAVHAEMLISREPGIKRDVVWPRRFNPKKVMTPPGIPNAGNKIVIQTPADAGSRSQALARTPRQNTTQKLAVTPTRRIMVVERIRRNFTASLLYQMGLHLTGSEVRFGSRLIFP